MVYFLGSWKSPMKLRPSCLKPQPSEEGACGNQQYFQGSCHNLLHFRKPLHSPLYRHITASLPNSSVDSKQYQDAILVFNIHGGNVLFINNAMRQIIVIGLE